VSFLNKYRGALGLENEDLEKEVDTEQEEQVEEQSEETTEQVEEKTEEQVEEQVEESTDEESKEESEEESEEEQETVVPAEPEETTEEAIQLDDSEAPAAGGSRLQAYREAAGLVEEETVTEEETETTTEEVEEKTEETSEEESEDKTEDKADEEEKKSAEDSEEEKEASSDEEGEKEDESDETSEEESDESVKALEALRDEIMVSYQRGGMTEGEASMVNVAVNNILARNGLQAERVVPSIESFSENSTRRRLATSTTADMINRIISKIKK
jgi:chromosome undetermined scaffold_175, whole genome shotgun sequence